jgi:hypothetical protein
MCCVSKRQREQKENEEQQGCEEMDGGCQAGKEESAAPAWPAGRLPADYASASL